MGNLKKIIKFLIFTVILQAPFYFLFRFKIFGIPLNSIEVTIFLIVIFYLYFIIFIQKSQIILKTEELFRREEFTPFILIIVGLALSLFIAENKLAILGILKSWFLIPFAFAFITMDVFKKEKQNILLYLFGSSFVVSFLALLYWLFDNLTYDGRLSAFYNSPNYLAMYVAPGLIIGLFLAYKNRKNLKIFALLSGISLIHLWILILTKSAGVFTALFLSIIFTFVFYILLKRKKLFFALIFLLLFCGILIPLILGNNKTFVANKLSLDYRSSSYSRLIIWDVASALLRKNWLLGVGAGNFQKKYLDFQEKYPEQYLEWAIPHPHNIFLSFWLGAGLLGFFGFALLIIYKFKKILYSQKNSAFGIIFLTLILYILFHGFIDATYWKNDLSLVFWLIVFLI